MIFTYSFTHLGGYFFLRVTALSTHASWGAGLIPSPQPPLSVQRQKVASPSLSAPS